MSKLNQARRRHPRVNNFSALLLLLLLSLVTCFCMAGTGSVVRAQTGETTIATVNGKSISQDEVDDAAVFCGAQRG